MTAISPSIAGPDSRSLRAAWLMAAAIIAGMTVLRIVYASALDLRTDEAYYWTWSKELQLCFLDHPPIIA